MAKDGIAKKTPTQNEEAEHRFFFKPEGMCGISSVGTEGLNIYSADITLVKTLETLKPHDHLCLIYESKEEWRNAVIPFLVIGLKQNEKCVYVVDTSTADEIRKYLVEEGIDAVTAEKSGQLTILNETDAYTREGFFDPDRMIALLISETEKAVAEGYPALRLTGEMTWVLRGYPGSEKLLEYEAKLNRDFFSYYPCLVICQYDRWKFDQEVIKGVIVTHPILVWGNNVYHNFYYIPPEEFLNHKCAEGEAQHWLNNIEREHQMWRELAESRQKYVELVDNLNSGLAVYEVIDDGRDFVLVDFNRAAERIEKISRDEVIGRSVLNVFPGVREFGLFEVFQWVWRTGKPEHHPVALYQDDRISGWRENYVYKIPGGKIVAHYDDLTRLKQAEEALHRSEENFRSTLEDSPLGIRIISADGETLYANQAFLHIYGYAGLEEFKKISVKKRYTPDSYTEHRLRKEKRVRGEYVPPRYEISIMRKDGKIRYLEVLRERVLWNGEERFQMIYQDITERKLLEAERQKVEKLESIGTLAGGIAHDFNNYLTGIMGNIGLARKYVEPEGQAFERLKEAEKALVRARDLTQQLLTFSRGGAPIKTVVSIGKLIRESASFALRGSNVKPNFFLPDNLWAVKADEGQINQVISNIVINADHATPKGGQINIEAENYLIKKRSVLPLLAGNYVHIAIKDSGVGIQREDIGRIFEPFFTTKQRGSGLGLASAYSIVKNHSGHIAVESEPGVGTSFHIYLPASKKQITAEEKLVMDSSILRGKERILVMDDEEMIREMLGKMLSLIGCEVELTSDGAEVIGRFKEAKEAGQPFDAVILDLTVPGGMGGKEAIKGLLEIDPQVKAIVSSGYASDQIMSEYKKYGFSAVLNKPYTITDIEKTLGNLLGNKEVGADPDDL
ncbi:MAG: MEDS domain-containing protein [Syntrophales bacterium]